MIAGHLQEKKGYWYIVLNLYDENGKRKPKWIATHLPVQKNKHKAEELLFQARHQYADSREFSGLLFSDYMLQWLEKVKVKVAPTTYCSYKYIVTSAIYPYFRARNITLTSLRTVDLQQYYDALLARGLSGNTVIHHHANIHSALKDAVRLDLVDRNVAELVERPKKLPYIPCYYSVDEANDLLDKLRGHWLWLPVLLSLFYGLRRSEVLGLQWRNIDFSSGVIRIQHTRVLQEADDRNVFTGRDTVKQRSSYRTLPMPEPLRNALTAERMRRYEMGMPPPDEYVCLNSRGMPIHPGYFSQNFKKFLRDHGLREIRLHDLRHTCASLLIQNRTSLIEVQQWLGHSTLSTTADLYAHLEYETKLASAETLKKIFWRDTI